MIRKQEFWENWKNKTKIEKKAIVSLKKAKNIIIESIPKKEIVSIYVKGSFPRREMNKKSDVDLVVVLKKSKDLQKLEKLEKKDECNFSPEIQISSYSLWELKTGKNSKNKTKKDSSPSRFIKHLNNFERIYGTSLEKENFFRRSEEDDLRGMIYAFRNIFLPDYEKRKFGFSEIIKQVFWLVENEQRFMGKNPPHKWKKLAESIMDDNHIVHEALDLRLNPTKDEQTRKRFIAKLNKYINKLEKE